MLTKLKAVRDKILKMHQVREGFFCRYTPFNVFVSMCEDALKRKEERDRKNPSKSSLPVFLSFWCFDADTFNDPMEGKKLIELSENFPEDSARSLLAKVYKDDLHKQSFYSAKAAFVGSLVSGKVEDCSIWGKKSLKRDFDYTYVDDYLPMWRDYADKGKGVCLGFNIKPSDGFPVYRVSYDESDHLMALDMIGSALREIGNISKYSMEIRELIDPIRFLYKSREHAHENEARVIIPCGIKKGQCKYEIKLFKSQKDATSYRLYISLEDFFFKNGGQIRIGPGFDESDYIFDKMVIIKQVMYWLDKLNLIDKVEVKHSKYNIRF